MIHSLVGRASRGFRHLDRLPLGVRQAHLDGTPGVPLQIFVPLADTNVSPDRPQFHPHTSRAHLRAARGITGNGADLKGIIAHDIPRHGGKLQVRVRLRRHHQVYIAIDGGELERQAAIGQGAREK